MNKEIKKERLDICKNCEYNSTQGLITKISKCKSCGCILNVKANDLESKCPKDKWKN
jgi:predicted Zn-ribbon and HTH transcriptional regulator